MGPKDAWFREVGQFSIHVLPEGHWWNWVVYNDEGYPLRDTEDEHKFVEGRQALTVEEAKAAGEAALKLYLSACLRELES